MSRLPIADLELEYLLHLSPPDLMSYCRSDKYTQKLCRTPWFWVRKLALDFPTLYNPDPTSAQQRYIEAYRRSVFYRQLLKYSGQQLASFAILNKIPLSGARIKEEIIHSIQLYIDSNPEEPLKVPLTNFIPEVQSTQSSRPLPVPSRPSRPQW